MSDWSLPQLLASLHEDIEQKLAIVRKSFAHPGTKGDANEQVWIELLDTYLPKRYQAAQAHVVDSNGQFSQQMDVVVFDRQYSPFIFTYQGQTIVPAESVYAVFEAKQTMDASLLKYAQDKIVTVRRLHRTSLSIPHAGGVYMPKPPIPILGGFLSLASEWNPAFGAPMEKGLLADQGDGRIDIGCVAKHGDFFYNQSAGSYTFTQEGKPATAFLFKLIALLQFSGTVPMIDIEAYSRWLTK